jgi:hypothetical protein
METKTAKELAKVALEKIEEELASGDIDSHTAEIRRLTVMLAMSVSTN